MRRNAYKAQRLKIWFNNNGRIGVGYGGHKLLNLQPKVTKPKKRLSMVQAYSKKYFPTKLQTIAQSRYQDHLHDVEAGLVDKLKPLDHRNKLVREFWESETQEVKEEIAAYREKLYLQGALSDEDGEGDSEVSDGEYHEDGYERRETSVPSKGKRKAKQPLTSTEAQAVEYNKSVLIFDTVVV